MKKIYQKPSTEILLVEIQQLMGASDGTLDPNQSIGSSDGFGSRDYDDWDD